MPLALESSSEVKIGESAPPRIRKVREGGGNKPQKYLYVCGENQTRVDEIESLLEIALPNIRERVQILTYTDAVEFGSHAQKTLITSVRSVVGICIGLTPRIVNEYFGEICRIATELLPKNKTHGYPRDLGLALCTLLSFGRSHEEFTLSPQNHTAWDHFLEIHSRFAETAWDIKDRFSKPLIHTDEEGCEHVIELLIGTRLDFG